MKDIQALNTEQTNKNTTNIDEVSILEAITKINNEDKTVAYSVEKELPSIAIVIENTVEQLNKGGRLIYIGAGTSGRLGVLDASECMPTYGVDPSMVMGLMAGGKDAMFEAKEGAEDSAELGVQDLKDIQLTSNDMVIGIAASGRTPYVIGALEYANSIGAKTAAIACSKDSLVGQVAQNKIEVITGPEVVTGSTRMKAGTAQKLVLNMISTTSMIQLGKVYGNLMVDVLPTNEKLVIRAKNMIRMATGCSVEEAERLYKESNQHVKTAIVMHMLNVDAKTAREKIEEANGRIKGALNQKELR